MPTASVVHRARDLAAVRAMLARIDEALERPGTLEAIAVDEGAELSLYPVSMYFIGLSEGAWMAREIERLRRRPLRRHGRVHVRPRRRRARR
jgi:hypothetical protein